MEQGANNTDGIAVVTEADLLNFVNELSDELYTLVKNEDTNRIEDLKKNLYDKLVLHYELNEKQDSLNTSKKLYIQSFIEMKVSEMIRGFQERIKHRLTIQEKLDQLKLLELPEQRSQAWYDIREKILTASSLADAIGEGHFSTREELLIQKCGGPRPEVPFQIVEWGVMYEPVATRFYELMNNLTVLEFGLVPHPEFKIFGASPDGICDSDSPPDYIGRMLEIKCPPKRKFTKEVPKHYWMQMQGQLESCDLEECDFLQVKLEEYTDSADYQADFIMNNELVKQGYSSSGLAKGLLLAFITYSTEGNPKIAYEYCEFYQSFDELQKWSEKVIAEYREKNIQYDECKKHWWKIERYECTLVGRDRGWWLSVQPKIIDFWEDVEHYRKLGVQVLLDKKEEKKLKKIKMKQGGKLKKPKKKPPQNVFEIQKATVEELQNNYFLNSD